MAAQITPFTEVDYLAEKRERVTYAFEDSPVFDKFLQLGTLPYAEIQQVIKQMMQERSLETAVGAQLDIIGRIVGQDRTLIEADLVPYFGFLGALAPESYGSATDSSVGGYWWDLTKPLAGNITLSDEQYRIFIKAKIMKNVTRATPEDVIKFIKFVFDIKNVYISLDSEAHALIFVSDDISLFEKVLLRYFTEGKFKSYFIPKTIGVRYDFGQFDPDNFFAYYGVPGAKGYGQMKGVGYLRNGTYRRNGTIRRDGGGGYVVDPTVGGKYAGIL